MAAMPVVNVSFILQFIHLKRCIISGKSSLHFSGITFVMVLFARGFGPVMLFFFQTHCDPQELSLCGRRTHLVVDQHLICIVWGSVNYVLQSYGPYQNWLCAVCSSVALVSVKQACASTYGSLKRVMRSLMYVHYLRRCAPLLWSSPKPLPHDEEAQLQQSQHLHPHNDKEDPSSHWLHTIVLFFWDRCCSSSKLLRYDWLKHISL